MFATHIYKAPVSLPDRTPLFNYNLLFFIIYLLYHKIFIKSIKSAAIFSVISLLLRNSHESIYNLKIPELELNGKLAS